MFEDEGFVWGEMGYRLQADFDSGGQCGACPAEGVEEVRASESCFEAQFYEVCVYGKTDSLREDSV